MALRFSNRSPRRIGWGESSDIAVGAAVIECRAAGSGVLERFHVGSVIKKRRKRMAKKKHRKLLKKTRVQRRKLGK